MSDWQKASMGKARQAVLELAGREVVITNPDKPFFPQLTGSLRLARIPLGHRSDHYQCSGPEGVARKLLDRIGYPTPDSRPNGIAACGKLLGTHITLRSRMVTVSLKHKGCDTPDDDFGYHAAILARLCFGVLIKKGLDCYRRALRSEGSIRIHQHPYRTTSVRLCIPGGGSVRKQNSTI
jgi:hypothetical protein